MAEVMGKDRHMLHICNRAHRTASTLIITRTLLYDRQLEDVMLSAKSARSAHYVYKRGACRAQHTHSAQMLSSAMPINLSASRTRGAGVKSATAEEVVPPFAIVLQEKPVLCGSS